MKVIEKIKLRNYLKEPNYSIYIDFINLVEGLPLGVSWDNFWEF